MNTQDLAKLLCEGDYALIVNSALDCRFPELVRLAEIMSSGAGTNQVSPIPSSWGNTSGLARAFSSWHFDSTDQWVGRRLEHPVPITISTQGDGIVRAIAAGVELVTLGAQLASIAISPIPKSETIVVHMVASFPSNVGNNFYLRLEGTEETQNIRFGNMSVTLANEGIVCEQNGRPVKLYTVVLTGSAVRFYTNGVLCASAPRSSVSSFERLLLLLVGEPGPDLSGCVHGIEIWCGAADPGRLFVDDQVFYSARLVESISAGNLAEVYHLLSSVREGLANAHASELLQMLREHAGRHGIQEWVIDGILRNVPSNLSINWLKENANILPAPIASIREVGADFMVSPNNRFSLSSIISGRGREKFTVLSKISFDVFPGDIVGILGPNGAGKSTLLRAIAGLMPIQRGEIILRAEHLLLSAGLGARNELTGRENIYLAGTFMGLSQRQIDEIFEEVWEFSELGLAIDKPFKYYSDGMKGRLVFSLATSIAPPILLLDELLSAGDIKFQKKAGDRMEQLLSRSGAVIVVTHSVPFVTQRCNKALLVASGRMAAYGEPKAVVAKYLNLLHLGDIPADADHNPLEQSFSQNISEGFRHG